MTPRERRAIAIGTLVALSAILALRVVPSVLRSGRDRLTLLREHATLLARTREEMASLPELRDSAAVLSQALIALAPQLLSGSTGSEAGADLSGRINLIASRAPAKVERLDPLMDSLSNGRLGRVRVHAAMETDVRGLVAVLKAVENGEEVLYLDELHVQALHPAGVERGPEILKVEVVVSGWYIKRSGPQERKQPET
ncbi:MAG TPA: type II secretion system protein GspM [Gemmatimonadales bacterium]|nr:type II secretion system protein GspM [Gemmatimonadales bacterium]